MKIFPKYFIVLLVPFAAIEAAFAANPVIPAGPFEETELTEALAVGSVGRSSRWPLHTDAVEYRIVAGDWSTPAEGDSIELPDGETRQWQSISADGEGNFSGRELRRGYACFAVESETDRVAVLHARGHGGCYVNGAPRGGNPYGYGYWMVPVHLKQGANELLFEHSRGNLRVTLSHPKSPAYFNPQDFTLPDLVEGKGGVQLGAAVVVNAGTQPMKVRIGAIAGGDEVVSAPLSIPPLASRKVPFGFFAPDNPADESVMLALTLWDASNQRVVDECETALRVRSPGQTRKETFVSQIDGSAQYYGVNPASPVDGDDGKALFLSLHGASVEAIGQADAYSSKRWGTLVAPTNRRPYGFDWEDWGRLDAMEVLDIATREFQPDPARVYLTGHSMGGHGTWQVGVHHPDRFAAIGPSAGWISFMSYTRAPGESQASGVTGILQGARGPSDTLRLKTNYAQQGVYILHGGADDNVPASEARTMAEELKPFHNDWVYHEEPGKGHWWDISDEPGADCVDWAPMFDFFARHAIPPARAVREVDFTTAHPGVSSSCHWAEIWAAESPLAPARVQLKLDPGKRRFSGAAENVYRLGLNSAVLPPQGPISIEIDGASLEVSAGLVAEGWIYLEKTPGGWVQTGRPDPSDKNPHRAGPFKDAFRNRMVFVYGTGGGGEENAWALDKARLDAETWWYRGNGGVPLMSDAEFLRRMEDEPDDDRNVILYGNANTNHAWDALLKDCPVRVERGAVSAGGREFEGADLACLFAYPRAGSATATVGVVSGSGLPGMKLTDRMPYFISGAAFPDWLVLRPESLRTREEGVVGAGFFGNDWTLENGQSAWNES